MPLLSPTAAFTPTRQVASAEVEQWLQAHARPPTQIQLGLERVQAVWQRLDAAPAAPVITVGGTNGKGSVCHLLAAILAAAGFRAGCYTSPHLLQFGERVRINGASTPDAAMLAALRRTAAAARAAGTDLTYFELTTLAALLVFASKQCEVMVLEVGLGGRLDAVNIIDPTVAVITNIGLDHTEYLGDTRDKIAVEKAGICRAGRPVVIGDEQPPPALAREVQRRGAVALTIGQDFKYQRGRFWHYRGCRHRLANLPAPALAGAHQQHNAALALCALEQLPPDYWPGSGAIRRGLHAVELPGRGQVLPGAPLTVLDVAHNVAAAAVLERQLFDMGYSPRTVAVLGMLARKDIAGFVSALARRIDHWHIAAPQGGDLTAEEIAAAVQKTGAAATAHSSIADAADAARADAGDGGRIVVTGSFLTVADYLQTTWRKNPN